MKKFITCLTAGVLIAIASSCKKEEVTVAPVLRTNPGAQNYDASICYDWYNSSDYSYITTTGYCGDDTTGPQAPPSPSYPGQVVGLPHGSAAGSNNIPSTDPNAPAEDLEYSGDAVDYVDSNNPRCPGSGPLVKMPSFIETGTNHTGVHITFGMTTSDNLSADQLVSSDLVAALRETLKNVNTPPGGPAGSKPFTRIFDIYIKATTNGSHATTSNHYRGLAVDISRINGQYVQGMHVEGNTSDLVYRLQDAFNGRENFGPSIKEKLGRPWAVGGHEDHIHFSVNCK